MGAHKLANTAVTFAVGLGALIASPPAVRALDVDPGDYVAAPAGTNLLIGYSLNAWRNSFQTKTGEDVSNSNLNSQVGIVRYVHYLDVGIIIDPQIFITFGSLNNINLGGESYRSSTGLGDTILASTAWLLNQPDQKRWLGVTPFVFLPTGKYQRDRYPFNVGENRYKGVLQVGYVQGFADDWMVDLIADTTFYGDNDRGPSGETVSQDNSYQLQAWLRYYINPNWALGPGYSGTFGGAAEVDGDSDGTATRAQQLRFITQYMIRKDVQLQAQVRRDVWAQGQFQEDFGLNFRVMTIF